MNNGSTSFEARLRHNFQSNPVGCRVMLPDGSLAVVRCAQDTDTGRSYKVQGIHLNGRFRALLGLSCWYSGHELRLPYFTASIREVVR